MAGDLLTRARRDAGFTQRAVAAAAEVRQPLISRIETGREQPGLPLLTRLVRACGFEVQFDLLPALDEHDRGLLTASLALSVEQRVDRLMALSQVADALRQGVVEARQAGL